MLCPKCGRDMAEEDGVFRCRFCGFSTKDKKSINKSRWISIAAGAAAAVFLLAFLFAGFMVLKAYVPGLRLGIGRPKHAKAAEPVGVSFTRPNIELQVGGSHTLKPIVSPSGAKAEGFIWESSDPSVASVDDEGNISAVAPGTAVVSAALGEIRAEAQVLVYQHELELLAAKIKREGKFDEDYGWYFLPVLYEESEENGVPVCRNTELIWSENSNEIALCCDVYDKDVEFFYETFVNFTFGDKQNADVYFYCSLGDEAAEEPVIIPASYSGSEVLEAEAQGKISIPNYALGMGVTFTGYDGDPEFRETAKEIASSMVTYSLSILKIRWNTMKMPCSLEEMTGFAKL